MEVRLQIIVHDYEWSTENQPALRVNYILGKIFIVLYLTFLFSSDPGKNSTKSYFYFTGSEKGIENWVFKKCHTNER